MTKQLLSCSLLVVLLGCNSGADIAPNASLAAQVAGTYHTNFYLDPSCVAMPASQMPYAEVKPESDSSVTFIFTRLYPTKTSQAIKHILLSPQPEGIQFRLAGSGIGSLKTDRIFMNNGMEKQGQLLRLSLQNDLNNSLYFAGIRQ